MSTWRALGSVLLAASLLFLASCSSSDPTVNLTKAEPDLEKLIQKKWFPTLEVGDVACPTKEVARSKGKVSTCTVVVENEPVEFRVIQTNAQGGVAPQRYEAILSTEKAEGFVRQEYSDIATVSCGDEAYFVRKPGTEFRCDVTANNGRDAEVIIEVVDPKGNVKRIGNT
jgi:hypothetical protein